MAAYWQRTGDPLGDFVRLTFLVEEALERLGADRDGTLGEKRDTPQGVFPSPPVKGGAGGLVAEIRGGQGGTVPYALGL